LWGSGWFSVPTAAAALICLAGYAMLRRRLLLSLALAVALIATFSELVALATLPDECGSSFLEVNCPPGRDTIRDAAWGLALTFGAAVSLTLACVAVLLLAVRRSEH
jgi:hypothetical protein